MHSWTLFIFLILWPFTIYGIFNEEEITQAWAETGYNFQILFEELTEEACYKSEVTFSACMITFHSILASFKKDKPYQLRVSDLNKLEIVPLPVSKNPTLEGLQALQTKRRESFRLLFRTHPPSSGEFEILIDYILNFSEEIPKEKQSKAAGMAYNTYLSETIDPSSSLYPKKLFFPRNNEHKIGIGIYIKFYKTENGETTWAIDPLKGSPARKSGLKKGDLILAIDDFDIRKLPVTHETYKDILEKLRGLLGTQVKLKILSICENKEKKVTVTRGGVDHNPYNWMVNNSFVNLKEIQTLDCQSEKSLNESRIEQLEGDNRQTVTFKTDSSTEPQALYLPLRNFEPPRINSTNIGPIQSLMSYFPMIANFPLCAEFIDLQNKDMGNPNSLGMIIDLRENTGGSLTETTCMLNSIIQSSKLLTSLLIIEKGQTVSTSNEDNIHYYLSEGGIPFNHQPSLYNKPIIVIVNKLSGSSSELFSGTIQELKRGWVVGDRTFGKGTAQENSLIRITSDANEIDGSSAKQYAPLVLSVTKYIYTLNSGRSPQGYGIIPDFLFSETGEPIRKEANYISVFDELFFNNIQFKHKPWEQNRPEEQDEINDCINEVGRTSKILKEKMNKDPRYKRPFAVDYQLQLAKDILICSHSPSNPSFIPTNYASPPYKREKTE